MEPSRVTDSDILAIWKRLNCRRRIRVAKVKFSVGQHVNIRKDKMKFPKGGEQTFSTKIFRITKVIERRPRPVYELEDLNKTPIEGQFYAEELTCSHVERDQLQDRLNTRQASETGHSGVSHPVQ